MAKRVLYITDLHSLFNARANFGGKDVPANATPSELLEAFVEAVNKTAGTKDQVDEIVFGGDFINKHIKDKIDRIEEYTNFARIIGRLNRGVNARFILGNHDLDPVIFDDILYEHTGKRFIRTPKAVQIEGVNLLFNPADVLSANDGSTYMRLNEEYLAAYESVRANLVGKVMEVSHICTGTDFPKMRSYLKSKHQNDADFEQWEQTRLEPKIHSGLYENSDRIAEIRAQQGQPYWAVSGHCHDSIQFKDGYSAPGACLKSKKTGKASGAFLDIRIDGEDVQVCHMVVKPDGQGGWLPEFEEASAHIDIDPRFTSRASVFDIPPVLVA